MNPQSRRRASGKSGFSFSDFSAPASTRAFGYSSTQLKNSSDEFADLDDIYSGH